MQPRPTPPPPRPAPPPQLPLQATTQHVPSKPAEPDLFDMFGTSDVPPQQNKPKSRDDILSLFSPPKPPAEEKPDFLTDIFSMANVDPVNSSPPSMAAEPPAAPAAMFAQQTAPAVPPAPPTPPTPPDESSTPIVLETHIPTEPEPVSAIHMNNIPMNTLPVDSANEMEVLSDNSSVLDSAGRTPDVATPYYAGGHTPISRGEESSSSPTAVPSRDEITAIYVSPTAANNPFASPEEVPRIPQRVAPVPTNIFGVQNDKFDAFAARFEKERAKSPLPPADGKLLL